MRLAYANGLLWAVGNGLVRTSLITDLARHYGATGLAMSLILAAPQLVGVLRLATPWGLHWLGDRRRFALAAYLMSAACIVALPWLASPLWNRGPAAAIAALVALWCAYQVLEYAATVALWSWLGDLAPRRIRGRFVGWREMFLVVGRTLGMVGAAALVAAWMEAFGETSRIMPHAIAATGGGLMMLAALAPLAAMPTVAQSPAAAAPSLAKLLAPFVDRRFCWLIVFGAWFSFFNGFGQLAQFLYPLNVLGFSIYHMLLLESLLYLAQAGLAPLAGRAADRIGNRRVLMFSQLVVGIAPVFFLLAAPARPYWWFAAWICWIAYVGLNVGLPNTMLKLAPRGNANSYIAVYFALAGLCYGIGALTGAAALTALQSQPIAEHMSAWRLGAFETIFLISLPMRLAGLIWLGMLREKPTGGRENDQ